MGGACPGADLQAPRPVHPLLGGPQAVSHAQVYSLIMWNPYLVPGPLLGPETAKVKVPPSESGQGHAQTGSYRQGLV